MKTESPAKKHHFWILLGLVPLLTLIGVLMVSSKVGGTIDSRQAEIDKASKDIGSKTNPKSNELIAKLDKNLAVVEKKQTDLHKENWERQKDLFTWPRTTNSRVFKALEDKGLKFGDPIPDLTAVHSEFQQAENYLYEYSSIRRGVGGTGTGMADLMAPTQFSGGWQRVLRYVDNFGQVIVNKDQVWLILEDMWVQRSLLSGLRTVNSDLATFERVRYERDGKVIDDPAKGATAQNKTKRQFRSRNWEVALEIVPEGNTYQLTGTLTNISDRLQIMGANGRMTLNVWLSTAPNAQPLTFLIMGELLPGKGAMKPLKDKDGKTVQMVPANVLPIHPLPSHTLSTGTELEKLEIARVEQVFDIRTVPLKRIEALVMGQLDSRNAAQPTLVAPRTPPFSKEFAGDPAAEGSTDGSGGGPGAAYGGGKGSPLPGGSAGGPPMPGSAEGPGGAPGGPLGGPGGLFGGAGVTGQRVGGGSLPAVIDGNKKRYIAATEQVRRMPVGLVVIVDQSYIQDVLLALSNSPLRFQITQVTWKRFRDTLDGLGGSSSSSGPGGGIDYSRGEGRLNFGGGDPDERGPRPGNGSSAGGPPRPPGPGGIGLIPGSSSGMPGPGGYPGMSPSGYPGSNSSVASESQVTSGLVELSVYGIVSLYEKYEAPKPADGAATTPTNAPEPTAPAPNTPAPAPNTTTPPKMRRRYTRA
ncbi:Uncharacterized protein OS=Planctomyces brasiliensis (strain ATCC 49424 / DSM 5305 / JCM 21570 / NBRC 103401 / IFAM 1448) GN=Plabr_4059 PE=4 SV=1 [Gemmata massiliana]|uniref:Uncharacterized protein n=1 Tax=Gemmata massiliana TaxID=1210884 RepID=A0A6P2DGZ4_9BACT|nr:hypothetical protein [Gemmata massiliana]VTS00913.1 Uncharacterized protein OS=Planctomyces brasiliensis (strain ATCC 49424 / DSM 5305 / JCM 21570 / NBRC 103401 / IFAM 1448) GN=Plabr_4059 PE=4 SV=1 [Gemmata massiliana]